MFFRKGLLFLSGTWNFFGPSYFETTLEVRKNIQNIFFVTLTYAISLLLQDSKSGLAPH